MSNATNSNEDPFGDRDKYLVEDAILSYEDEDGKQVSLSIELISAKNPIVDTKPNRDQIVFNMLVEDYEVEKADGVIEEEEQ